MFDESLELADVLAKLRRADDALGEFIAPLWPGVSLAAAWIEGQPRLFHLDEAPEQGEGYYLLVIDNERARVLRAATDDEIARYLGHLTKASVILLENGLAYPASSVERLQGIIDPRPLHFATGAPLTPVQARFDGLNLFYDGGVRARKTTALEDLFAAEPLFTPGELLGHPGQLTAGDEAQHALENLRAHPELATGFRVKAVLDTGGAEMLECAEVDGAIRLRWRADAVEHLFTLQHPDAPITSGISLAGARAFDPATLTHLLVEHVLDAWQ